MILNTNYLLLSLVFGLVREENKYVNSFNLNLDSSDWNSLTQIKLKQKRSKREKIRAK